VGLGQEIIIPAGECRIFLITGSKIENVQLRKIDSIKVEYVKGGNLNDIRTAQVSSIETRDYIMYFDKNQKVHYRKYDQLFLKKGDTVTGVIVSVNDQIISIRLKSTSRLKKYWPTEVEKYTLGTDAHSNKNAQWIIPVTAVSKTDSGVIAGEGNSNKVNKADDTATAGTAVQASQAAAAGAATAKAILTVVAVVLIATSM
jgi:hypothetical protein